MHPTSGTALVLFASLFTAQVQAAVSGDLKQWHEVLVTIAGPSSSQDATPNPFLDYRFNVTFTAPSGKTYVVPGYFAGDGAGGAAGNVWAAHLNPHETGAWTWRTSFRSGTNVAVDLAANAGSLVAAYDGQSGTFAVAASDKTGADFRAADKGMLVNRGQHYLTYGGSGKPFLFTGPGIPENILGYRGFTNTTVGIGHLFDAHLAHWKTGDPDWNNGAGKKLIGALNYIADNGGNCIYLMSQTIGGDGQDCFPHPTTTTTKTRYDLLKLRQWDIALAHAQRKGIYLHWVLAENETANYTYYGGSATAGSLTTARKLYFRMLVARFGHYNGLKWNLCEEIEWVKAERVAQMAYLKAIDPYDHPVTHQAGGAGLGYSIYDEQLGNSDFDAMSFQGSESRTGMFDRIKEYRDKSAAAGVKWTSAWDEPQKIENDITDAVNGYPMGRRDKMWPCLMGGGDGFLWYIQADGGGHGFDQRIEDFSIMRDSFRWSGYVRDFLSPLPLTAMTPSRSIVTSTTGEDYALYQAGEVYAIFNDRAGTGMTLNLSGVPSTSTFTVRWFDPRNGGALKIGTVATITGGGARSLGNAPSDTAQDWAVLVQRVTDTPLVLTHTLINADTDQPIAGFDPLINGTVLNLAQLPTRNLAVRANASATVGSVQMVLSGALARTQTESVAPYSLFGDTAGNFPAWTPALGSYGLTSTAYSASQAGGTVMGTQTIAFTVIDQTVPVNAAPTVAAGPDRTITLPAVASLAGTVDDDGLPAGALLTSAWTMVSGPGTVTFTNAAAASTSASFSAAGTYVLRLSASDTQLSASDEVQVTVLADSGPFITFTLINADTDLPIAGFDTLADGTVLRLTQLPTRNLAVRANVNGTPGSVKLELSGAQTHVQIENLAPYALHGNTGTDYAAWTPVVGAYGLTAIAYSETKATGTVLGTTSIALTVVEGGLPAGWTGGDIGAAAPGGSAEEILGTWTLHGAGADIWGTVDGFQYARLPLAGDCRLTVKVVAQTATNPWAKAGLMLRASADANARHVSIFVTPGNGVCFQRRTAIGGTSATTPGPRTPVPVWLRLERLGTTIIGSTSTDGSTWTQVGSVVNDLGATPLAGLAVTSHLAGTLSTAVFTDLAIVTQPVGNG